MTKGQVQAQIEGVIFTPLEAHADERGRFVEVFRQRAFPTTFVQTNHSRSRAGVLRGLHYHRTQADLWYLVSGRAQVALVDLRRHGAPASQVLELSDEEPSSLYIPPGVAHGFLALADVDLIYAVSSEYDASDEYGIAWNDPSLQIPWQLDTPILSDRDSSNLELDWATIPSFS